MSHKCVEIHVLLTISKFYTNLFKKAVLISVDKFDQRIQTYFKGFNHADILAYVDIEYNTFMHKYNRPLSIARFMRTLWSYRNGYYKFEFELTPANVGVTVRQVHKR